MAPKKPAVTAVKKLELSKVPPGQIQREMMGDDLDLHKLVVYLKSQILFDTTDRVVDIVVTRQIDGASTIDVTLNDYDRSILQSWALNAKLDIQIDGMWFRLVSCSKTATSDNLQLTFEQREIALLRSYPKPDTENYTFDNAKHWVKWANRDKATRAEFILNLIREVKEVDIPVVMPHLHQVQNVAKQTDISTKWKDPFVSESSGIPADYNTKHAKKKLVKTKGKSGFAAIAADVQNVVAGLENALGGPLTSKHKRMDSAQITNANTILTVGNGLGARRKVLVASIMTAMQESNLYNLSGGDGTSAGLFQQIDQYWGSYADRTDPATSSRMFFNHAIPYDKDHPDISFNDLCQGVQNSGHPTLYGQWRPEAERIVSAFGIPPGGEGNAATGGAAGSDSTTEGDAATANNMGQIWTNPGTDGAYYYYRGIPPTRNKGWWKREDNWTCIQRLAQEVGWRAFFIGGVFYFLTDDDLFKTQPIATINEETPGVMGIGFDYDVGRKGATVDLPCQVGLWLAPPGSLVILTDMGPLEGRWLVSTFTRSLFNDNADIQLVKPQPKLPEPNTETFTLPTWASGSGNAQAATGAPDDTNQAAFGGIVGINNADRKSVVAVAQRALEVEKKWHYKYPGDEGGDGGSARPIPSTLWSADAHDALDCSAFATLCYKEAGCADPNGNNYNGSGYTGDLANHGLPVTVAAPGDLLFYGSGWPYHHVAVYVGNGMQIQIGSAEGIKTEAMDGPGPVTAIRSYLPL